MNNYTILLEQFQFLQQQPTATHQQFSQIIDYIHNEKQIKQSLLIRRKQQKVKLIHQNNRNKERNTSIPKLNIRENNYEELYEMQEINYVILKKDNEQLEKQLHKIRKQVKQMEDQLTVYNRKENQVKQVKYTSKRQLENSYLKLKNQKLYNLKLQDNYYKIIQQFMTQKTNMEHQNRYLADQLHQIKHLTKNFMKVNGMLDNFGNCFDVKIEQVYSKKKIQEKLRCIYALYFGKKNLEGLKTYKNFFQIQNQSNKDLYIPQHFHFLTKTQILDYYLNKLNIFQFTSIIPQILSFYNYLTNNIKKLQNRTSYLNIQITQLKQQQQKYIKIVNQIQFDKFKNTVYLIQEWVKQNSLIRQKVQSKCQNVYQILEREYKLVDRMRRIIHTLDNILDKSQQKSQSKYLNITNTTNTNNSTLTINTNGPGIIKGNSSFQKDKRNFDKIKISNNLNNISLQIPKISTLNTTLNGDFNTANPNHSYKDNHTNRNIPKDNYYLTVNGNINPNINVNSNNNNNFNTSNKIGLNFKLFTHKTDKIINQFQFILVRNPTYIIHKWQQIIRDNDEGLKFLHNIFQNDLYRIFVDPQYYNPNVQSIQNYNNCINKVYENTAKLLNSLKQSLLQSLKYILNSCKQMQKVNNSLLCSIHSASQPKFVIQSKGYYRFDNFKLLEKLSMIQAKKKGIYVPYSYGVDIQQQLIYDKNTKKQTKLDSLQKVKINLSCRNPRNTAPQAKNYISSYRQKLNKADKKIRDLLNNVDSLKIMKKSTRQLSNRQSRRLTQFSIRQI